MRARGGLITAVAVGAIMLTVGLAAEAGTINRRQHRQAHRIANGVRTDALTWGETARLPEQARIRAEERHFRRSGGGLSRREYIRLQRDLNRASRHIFRQKHDRQRR